MCVWEEGNAEGERGEEEEQKKKKTMAAFRGGNLKQKNQNAPYAINDFPTAQAVGKSKWEKNIFSSQLQ